MNHVRVAIFENDRLKCIDWAPGKAQKVKEVSFIKAYSRCHDEVVAFRAECCECARHAIVLGAQANKFIQRSFDACWKLFIFANKLLVANLMGRNSNTAEAPAILNDWISFCGANAAQKRDASNARAPIKCERSVADPQVLAEYSDRMVIAEAQWQGVHVVAEGGQRFGHVENLSAVISGNAWYASYGRVCPWWLTLRLF